MAIKTEGKMTEEIKEDLMFMGEHLDPLRKKALGNICKAKVSISITNSQLVINSVSLMWLMTDIKTIITIDFSVRDWKT